MPFAYPQAIGALLLFLVGTAPPFPSIAPAIAPALGAVQAPAVSVRVDPVRAQELREERPVTGDLRAARRAVLPSIEAGVLIRLDAREGDRVAAGDIVARIRDERLELSLKVLEAEVLVADALITERRSSTVRRERDLAVLLDLEARGAANPKEIADAKSAASVARARLAHSDAARLVLDARMAQVQDRIEDASLRAPFAGFVVKRHAELGEWVAEGGPVLEIVSDALEVWLDVPERYVGPVAKRSGPLALRVDATGAEHSIVEWRVIPAVDPLVRTFTVIGRLDAPPSDLVAGMSVEAYVPTAALRTHLTVANDALLRNEIGNYLFVAVPGKDDTSSARPVSVEILFRRGARAVVRGALEAGDFVVVEGNERLYPGAPLQVAGFEAEPTER